MKFKHLIHKALDLDFRFNIILLQRHKPIS
jgi:hypothetical protein